MDVLNIVGSSQQQIPMSSIMNCSPALSTSFNNTRVYGVWAVGQPGYISIGPNPSTGLTIANGFLIPTGQAPILFSVPPLNQIAAVSSSSGILAYEQVR